MERHSRFVLDPSNTVEMKITWSIGEIIFPKIVFDPALFPASSRSTIASMDSENETFPFSCMINITAIMKGD
jgi:hypothetical protein